MPTIAARYDSSTGSTAGEANPSATPAGEAAAQPAGGLALTTNTLPATAPQIQPEQTDATLTPAERSVKAENWGSKVYHGVLNALGGGGDVAYSRDSKTGKMTATPVQTGPGTQWKKIIAGAISGWGAAASAGSTGPGAAMRMAGAGVSAGYNMATSRDERARAHANEDYEAAQKSATQQAQLSLLSHQITKSVFDLGRAQVEASVQDSERESNFEKVIADGGQGSTDMGNFPDFQAVMKAFQEAPALHDHQAGGRIITIPHINGKGQVDGVHAALVTPDWLNSKINRELPITVRSYRDGKVEESTFTVPAGSLTGNQYAQMVMAQSKDAIEDFTKTAQAKATTSEAASRAALVPSEIAKNMADAEQSQASALLAQSKAASEGQEVDWGPGGEKGFTSWHDKNVTPALQAERTYRLASNIYNEYQTLRKQGKDFPTGAQSVQMLSYHMAGTFGNVKGARITKDLIQKHLGARSVSDAAEVAINKLYNGEQLSPPQWDAFFSMVGQTRDETWRSVLDDAESLGRPLDYIAFPQDLRNRWGLPAGRVSLDRAQQPTNPQGAPQRPGQQPNQAQQLPGTGKTISLKDARGLPQYKGKTDAEIQADAKQLGYTVNQ